MNGIGSGSRSCVTGCHCTLYIVHWVIKWLPVMLEVRLTCRLQFLFDLFQKKGATRREVGGGVGGVGLVGG